MKITITVSGPKCSGKSTIAEAVSYFLSEYIPVKCSETTGKGLRELLRYDPELSIEVVSKEEP